MKVHMCLCGRVGVKLKYGSWACARCDDLENKSKELRCEHRAEKKDLERKYTYGLIRVSDEEKQNLTEYRSGMRFK